MTSMGIMAERWLERYRQEFKLYELAADEIESQVRQSLDGQTINVHLITARAKSVDSVSEKIQRQSYGRPGNQFDDLLGVRIITLFDHSVVDVVKRIRSRFDVEESRSSNKSDKLHLRQVGYRSHHLVIKTRAPGRGPAASILKDTYIEVQIRSVIAHSWAEIEHSLRYKIGDGIPNDLGRRFDALAGTLELVDREFSNIEQETVKIVGNKVLRYSEHMDLDDSLSTIQLLGALRCSRPDMKSLGPKNLVLAIEDAFRFAKILVRCNISNVAELLTALQDNRVYAAIDTYSDLLSNRFDPSETSGIAVLGIVIGLRSPNEFNRVQAFADPKLQESLGLL